MKQSLLLCISSLSCMCVLNGCFLLENNECGEKGSGCDGNTMVWCENNDNDNPFYYDCGAENLVCVRENSEKPQCALGCKKSELDNKIFDGCIDPETVRVFECQINGVRKLLVSNPGAEYYYNETSEKCEHGCDMEIGDCITIHPEEYSSCDDTYVPSCFNDALSFCKVEDLTVHAIDCAENDQTCGIVDGEAKCTNRCDPSSFQQTSTCITIDDQEYSRLKYCDENHAPNETDTFCKNGCLNETGSCKIHPDEGNSCNMTGNLCKDDILLYCNSSDKIVAYDCIKDNQVCGHDSENHYGCMQPCSNEGSVYTCSSDGEYSNLELCSSQNNKLVLENSAKYCEHGCDASNGQCIETE